VRGGDNRTGELFSYVDLEARVRRDHPLRPIRVIVEALAGLEGEWYPFRAAALKQRHNLLRAEPLQHDQSSFPSSFSHNAWSKKARSGHEAQHHLKRDAAGGSTSQAEPVWVGRRFCSGDRL
jgi:hypothetical protein